MKNMNTHIWIKTLIVSGTLFSAAACSSTVGGDDFFSEDNGQTVNRFTQVQAASGARADANLYATHFDGKRLNSLGTQKLSLMLEDDDSATPMIVHLAFNNASPELISARTDSVVAYLTDSGLQRDQIELREGPNPDAKGLASLDAGRVYVYTERGLSSVVAVPVVAEE